jgi:Ca2+-binding EF-hand superfamily protein
LLFQKADVNGDGLLSAQEYYRILKEHGIDCSHNEIVQMIQIADKDHDGFISREEFLGDPPKDHAADAAAAATAAAEAAEKRVERAFNVFDKNNDGYITKAEMLKLCKNLTKEQVCEFVKVSNFISASFWIVIGLTTSVRFLQVDAVFARNDFNHDGRLTREEFEEFMSQHAKK